MRKSLVFVFAVLMLAGATLAADKWTPAQKEVWDAEQQFMAAIAKGDAEAALAFFHPDYIGSEYDDEVPMGKESVKKWTPFYMGRSTVAEYEMTPLAIQVYGNIAFVHYYYHIVRTDKKGEDKASSWRWTDILMKQDGKWLFIGDHGGKVSK
jgi:uncharacterized protein (TIGR02246 family)